ncbi:AraC family transcriptional regulator [Tenacibaculum sp.]|uniref:AraC family transcriptional regulator n=1 Tax=Tenacibaculum sp. TaxID=1906242 RepID=UPI003D110832
MKNRNLEIQHHYDTRKLTTLIENKTTYASEYAELNIFETYQATKNVVLNFDSTIIASMLTGKKSMTVDNGKYFDFLPGESLVIPENLNLHIDFPDATFENPTQCLGLSIDQNKINEVVYNFNEVTAIERENNKWNLKKDSSHLTNNTEIDLLVSRLTSTFIKNTKSKDVLLDLMIQELIIRLLQSKARQVILNNVNDAFNDTRIGFTVKYIKEHLTENDLTLDKMAEKACMSKSHFIKKFKNTLGVTPIDFLNSEKIKLAKQLIKSNPNERISNIAYKVGFNNVSYFNRLFKKCELLTPQQFRNTLIKS